MRTLSEIIECARSRGKPTVDEGRYAICALDSLSYFDGLSLMRLAQGKKDGKTQILIYDPEWQWKEHHNRFQRALARSPKEWLGENNDPDNDDVQNRRKISQKIANESQSMKDFKWLKSIRLMVKNGYMCDEDCHRISEYFFAKNRRVFKGERTNESDKNSNR